jgi:hypothetical protein
MQAIYPENILSQTTIQNGGSILFLLGKLGHKF